VRACLIAGLLVLVGGAASAQPEPVFDVASVRMSQPGDRGGSSLDPGRLSVRGETLRGLILSVYKVPAWRVSGGPTWLDTDGYDITATFPPNTSQDQVGIMLQNLLGERFKLAIHREMRDSSVCALVVAKGGPKLKEAAESKFSANRGTGHLEIHHADMALFARNIPVDAVDLPIVDMTGLQGYFDFALDWTPDTAHPGRNDAGPSIYTALQEQLGLKLEARRMPIEFIVIDHIERPAEN
jgi:uncharacterized protein (TIGR03435 family)